jgi:hypothetical protein
LALVSTLSGLIAVSRVAQSRKASGPSRSSELPSRALRRSASPIARAVQRGFRALRLAVAKAMASSNLSNVTVRFVSSGRSP